MKRILFSMVMTLVASATNALTAVQMFEAQTFALFDKDHISLEVNNESINHNGPNAVASGNLIIKIRTDRQEILSSLEDRLRTKFVNYKFPEGMNSTHNEQELADKILSNGIAEYILRATLGSNITRGVTIYRPDTLVKAIKDPENGEYYLAIFGEKIYVNSEQ